MERVRRGNLIKPTTNDEQTQIEVDVRALRDIQIDRSKKKGRRQLLNSCGVVANYRSKTKDLPRWEGPVVVFLLRRQYRILDFTWKSTSKPNCTKLQCSGYTCGKSTTMLPQQLNHRQGSSGPVQHAATAVCEWGLDQRGRGAWHPYGTHKHSQTRLQMQAHTRAHTQNYLKYN